MTGGGYISKKMKRKELELDDVNNDFSDFSLSAPATKIRRLDVGLPPIMEEEEREMPMDFGNSLQVGDILIEELPCDPPVNEERAIVLFNPVNQAPMHSLSSYSISSDIILGLKNRPWSNQSGPVISIMDEEDCQNAEDKKCLAVIPWVPSQTFGQEVEEAGIPDVMDSEDVGEAMEIEDDNNASIEQQGQGLQHQWHQQHCMTPQLPQNISTPIVWYP